MNMPTNHQRFTDKYFLRSKAILEKEGLNPITQYQFFIRKGPGMLCGIEDAAAFIQEKAPSATIRHLSEGEDYTPSQGFLIVEGRAQELIDLETVALGRITKDTSLTNGGEEPNLEDITLLTRKIIDATKNSFSPQGRSVSYFGARHWGWEDDAEIARAAYKGGATTCSTDAGAEQYGATGIGTIPHALENIFAWKYGAHRAVVEATKAFDRHMDPSIPRVALIDYNNREVDDAIATADALEGRLGAVRIDTCGENVAQGALAEWEQETIDAMFGGHISVPKEDRKYWVGTGVTVTGAYAVREGLDKSGHKDVNIMLSSGFGNLEKVLAFTRAEEILGRKLYDGLGVGGLYKARMATADIVAVGETRDALVPMSKIGREYRPDARLMEVAA